MIDSHCHLHDREFFSAKEAELALDNAHKAGITDVIVIGTDPKDSAAARAFAESHENVFWTWGIHPENPEPRFTKPEKSPKLVAIGEVGLDYHYNSDNKKQQIALFEQMLQLAKDLDLPLSLHIREAFDDAFAVLDNFPDARAVVHSFTGSKKELKRALSKGYFIGVNGLATYSTLPVPPLDRILLETDAPFLTPAPFRGTIKNEPKFIREIAVYLSGIFGLSLEEISEETSHNVNRLYHLHDSGLRGPVS